MVVLVTEAGGTVTDLSEASYQFNHADTRVDGVVADHRKGCAVVKGLVDAVSTPT